MKEAETDAASIEGTVCTCAVLRRATRRVTQLYDRALAPAGLRLTQYSVLANVIRAGGPTVTDLADRLIMDRTTLTRTLRPLERSGWIRVAKGPDRRSRAVQVTDAGRRRYEAAVPLWLEAERALRRSMGEDRADALRRLLEDTGVAADG